MRPPFFMGLVGALLLFAGAGQAQSGKGAFWRSLVVPGWGQQHAGRKESAERFLAAELVLWGGYLAFEWLGQVREKQFRAYAAEHAGARGQGKEFFDDLGFYQSRLQHDQFALYEDGPEAQVYSLEREFSWEWDSDQSRQRYRKLRNSSQSARRQAVYLTGLVVVNHLAAAVHAGRSAGKGQAEDKGGDMVAGIDPRDGSVRLAFRKRFY
jgi:hypothetical protein